MFTANSTSLLRRRLTSLRAALALLLIAGFYATVFLLAAAFVYLPILNYQVDDDPTLDQPVRRVLLIVFGIIVAATMLWSIRPRRDKFNAPGPLLERSSHPRLFSELDSIAKMLNEQLPTAVYLIPEVNAWVTNRGGLMGLGSRRVMGLGLPLLSALTVSQFRAVVAHEFGHFNGGDSRLAPLVYRTRQAMYRTIENMDLIASINIFIVIRLARWLSQKLLRSYMDFYLRFTSQISQWQEYRADELACRVAGSFALIDGLKRIQVASRVFPSYWDREVLPVLRVGYHPPVADGFSHFCQMSALAISSAEIPNKNIREAQMVPRLFSNLPSVTRGDTSYDSHPPLSARIVAVSHLPSGSEEQNTDMAATLLGDLQEIELRFLEEYGPQPKGISLKFLNWPEVGKFVMEPQWKKAIAQNGQLIAGITVENLPNAVHRVREIGAQMSNPKGMLLTAEQRAKLAAELLGMALGLALINCGWEINTAPGQFAVRCGDKSLDNMCVVDEMVSGKLTPETWTAQCRALGIADLPLGGHEAARGMAS